MPRAGIQNSRILIIDDQPANVLLLERILGNAGYLQFRSVLDSRHAAEAFLDFHPDLVPLDLAMPHVDGYAVLKALRSYVPDDAFLPIVIVTADTSWKAKECALSLGASDFLTKPFENAEVLLRISNLLETRFLHLQLQRQNANLESKVRERTSELEEAQVEILQRLAMMAEYRDDATGCHTQRVGQLSAAIAHVLGLTDDEVDLIRLAAPLHDLGKVGIVDAVLLKPGKLTGDEYERMREHVLIGARILSGSHFPLLQLAESIALSHHERWDGTGYHLRLHAEQIPLASRIVAVADVFDALTHERPYKRAWQAEEALAEIEFNAGSQFDPRVVDSLREVLRYGYLDLEPQESLAGSSAKRDNGRATLAVIAEVAPVRGIMASRNAAKSFVSAARK